jgi:hypothetical protein
MRVAAEVLQAFNISQDFLQSTRKREARKLAPKTVR